MADKIKQESMPTTGNVTTAPTGEQVKTEKGSIEAQEHKSEMQDKYGVHYPKGK